MSRSPKYQFRLFVADNAQNSAAAVANLTALCKDYLPGRHKIEVIDVFKQPARALAEGIFMTPTLIKLAPAPVRKVVGTLSQELVVMHTLGLEVRGP